MILQSQDQGQAPPARAARTKAAPDRRIRSLRPLAPISAPRHQADSPEPTARAHSASPTDCKELVGQHQTAPPEGGIDGEKGRSRANRPALDRDRVNSCCISGGFPDRVGGPDYASSRLACTRKTGGYRRSELRPLRRGRRELRIWLCRI